MQHEGVFREMNLHRSHEKPRRVIILPWGSRAGTISATGLTTFGLAFIIEKGVQMIWGLVAVLRVRA